MIQMNKILTGGILILVMQMNACAQSKDKEKKFTESLMQDSCQFSVTGRNAYFILEPGYQLILEGHEDNKSVRLVVAQLDVVLGRVHLNKRAFQIQTFQFGVNNSIVKICQLLH